jgi:hypothetical protein
VAVQEVAGKLQINLGNVLDRFLFEIFLHKTPKRLGIDLKHLL